MAPLAEWWGEARANATFDVTFQRQAERFCAPKVMKYFVDGDGGVTLYSRSPSHTTTAPLIAPQ